MNRAGRSIRESSENALRIMQITTVMVVILIAWCLITTIIKGFQPVPWPTRGNLNFGSNALGWLKGTVAPQITFIAILVLEDTTKSQFHILGQHPTQLWPEDFERIHRVWLEISRKEPGAEIRDRDVVRIALSRLDKDFHSDQGSEILDEIHRETLEQKRDQQSGPEPSKD